MLGGALVLLLAASWGFSRGDHPPSPAPAPSCCSHHTVLSSYTSSPSKIQEPAESFSTKKPLGISNHTHTACLKDIFTVPATHEVDTIIWTYSGLEFPVRLLDTSLIVKILLKSALELLTMPFRLELFILMPPSVGLSENNFWAISMQL